MHFNVFLMKKFSHVYILFLDFSRLSKRTRFEMNFLKKIFAVDDDTEQIPQASNLDSTQVERIWARLKTGSSKGHVPRKWFEVS